MNTLDRYKNWLLINGASDNTVKNYYSRVNYFLEYIKFTDITEENITSFFLHLKEKYPSKSTINCFRNALYSYVSFNKLDVELPKYLKLEKKPYEFITEEYFIDA